MDMILGKGKSLIPQKRFNRKNGKYYKFNDYIWSLKCNYY